jgi:hypothetical protein
MTRKIVINKSYGGFGLSDAAVEMYLTKKNISFTVQTKKSILFGSDKVFFVNGVYFLRHLIERDDPVLIETIEQLGEEASEEYSDLKIIEIPADVKWHIQEYDGEEWIAENHRTWE